MLETSIPRAIIFTANEYVYEAVGKQLNNLRTHCINESIYEVGCFLSEEKTWEILIYQVYPTRNANVGIAVERATNFFQPEVAFFIGLADGVKDVQLGDVVVANKVYNFEVGEVTETEILTQPEVGNSTFGLVEYCRVEARHQEWLKRTNDRTPIKNSPKVVVGPVASGEKVIKSTQSNLYNLIHKHYNDTLALETASSGFLTAAYSLRNLRAIVIQGIAGLIGEKTDENIQLTAADYAGAFAFQVLSKLAVKLDDPNTQEIYPPKHPEKSFSIFRNTSKDYLTEVIAEYETLKLQRLGSSISPNLIDLFLEARLAIPPNSGHLVENPISSTNAKKVATETQRLEGATIWDYLNSSLGRNKVLIISGAFGMGKSTLLQHVAYDIAKGNHFRGLIPVMVPLVNLTNLPKQINQYPSLTEAILTLFKNRPNYDVLNIAYDWLEQRLRRGQCVVLLDGLDEIGDVKQRENLISWLDTQISRYRKSRFILTTRPTAYKTLKENLRQSSLLVQIQPFNRQQQRLFLEKWYLLNNTTNTKEISETIRQKVTDLYKQLNTLSATRDIAFNPLMLTMLAITYNSDEILPASRIELYSEICKYSFENRKQNKQTLLTQEQKLTLLQLLADHMMVYQLRQITEIEAVAVLERKLVEYGQKDLVSSILKVLQESTSYIWLQVSPTHWSFAHFSFQEYFQVCHWLENNDIEVDWSQYVKDAGKFSWWYNALTLYVSKPNIDVTILVKTCLTYQNFETLTLVAFCLTTQAYIDQSIRRQAQTVLKDNLKSSDPEERHLAAEVALRLRFKNCQLLDEGSEISNSYVTCAEYELFLENARTKGYYHQPDHWLHISPPLEEMDKPVRGIRAEDAKAFCDWLTVYSNEEYKYNLPSVKEVTESPIIQPADLASWCADYTLSIMPHNIENELKEKLGKITNVFRPKSLDLATPLPQLPDLTKALLHPLERSLGIGPGLTYKAGHNNLHDKRNRYIMATIMIFPVIPLLVWIFFNFFNNRMLYPSIFGVLIYILLVWGIMSAYDAFTTQNSPVRALKQIFASFADLGRIIIIHPLVRLMIVLLLGLLITFGVNALTNIVSIKGWLGATIIGLTILLCIRLGIPVSRVIRDFALPKNHDQSNKLSELLISILDSVQSRNPNFLPETRQHMARDLLLILGDLWHYPNIKAHLQDTDLLGMYTFLQELQNDQTPFVHNRGELLTKLLATLQTTNPAEIRQAERNYVAKIVEYAITGYTDMRQYSNAEQLQQQEAAIRKFYWWLQVIMQRYQDKTFPAWEGLRFVRSKQVVDEE